MLAAMGTRFSDYLAGSEAAGTAEDTALREAFAAHLTAESEFWAHARDTGHQTLEIFVIDGASCQVFCDFVPSLSLDDADELLREAGYERMEAWRSGMHVPSAGTRYSYARARKIQVV